MAAAMRVAVVIDAAQLARVRNVLASLSAPRQAKPVSAFLTKAAYAVLTEATTNQIIRGSQFGGKHAKPDPVRLTNRHGGAGLVGSLSLSRGSDLSGLPRYVDVGSTLKYAPIHEFGGTITVSSHKRTLHKVQPRKNPFGVKLIGADITIGSHTATYPKRPFLAPAVAAVSPRFELMLEAELAKAVTEAAR